MRKSLFVLTCVLLVPGLSVAQEYPTITILDPVDASYVNPDTLYMIEISLDPGIPHDIGTVCAFLWRLTDSEGEELGVCYVDIWIQATPSGNVFYDAGNAKCWHEDVMNTIEPRRLAGRHLPSKTPLTIVGELRLAPEGAYHLGANYGPAALPVDSFCEMGTGATIQFFTTD